MNKSNEYKALIAQLDVIHQSTEHIVDAINRIYVSYWEGGYSTGHIATELGVLRSTVRAKITKLGYDWREREEPKPEPKPKGVDPFALPTGLDGDYNNPSL